MQLTKASESGPATSASSAGIISLLLAAITTPSKGKTTNTNSAGSKPGKTAVAVTFRPLTPRERTQLFAIAHTDSILTAIITCYDKSKVDGPERGFFIYQDQRGSFYQGEIAIGIASKLPTLAATHKPRNARTGDFDDTIAYYHTHPGNNSGIGRADDADRDFGLYYRAFLIIQSIEGFTIGGY